MTPGIERNMVAKKTVFDRQQTIVQMAPLQTKSDQKVHNELKQRKAKIDAKYMQME